MTLTMRLLVIEDESYMAELLSRGFAEEGHAVDVAPDGARALAAATTARYDAAVLDVMLPDVDGFELCSRIRESDSQVPVLMLTARDTIADRIKGLDAGADDYLCKPFSFGELSARIRALVRRAGTVRERTTQLQARGVRLDRLARRVWRGSDEVGLSAKEFALLELLLRHRGEVLSRDRIFEQVWGFDSRIASNLVDQYVRYLRHKLGPELIETVRGVGYRLPAAPP